MDMSGGAAVLERSAAIAELELPLNVVAVRARDGEHAERNGFTNPIGLVDVDAGIDGRFGIDIEGELHQRLGTDNGGRRALHHGDIGAGLPQIDSDVMAGAGGADDDGFFAVVSRAVGILVNEISRP